jgi:hypothetical protein
MTGIQRFSFVLLVSIAMAGSARATSDKFAHIFVIVEENHGYGQIIGNAKAPNINKLAQDYGSATNFYAEVHPSEANYIAMIAGGTFGIHDDDAFFCTAGSSDPNCVNAKVSGYANHTISARSLMDQLSERRLTWKGYFENLPRPGSKDIYSPASPGQPAQLYSAKHNAFLNFASVQKDPALATKIVGFDQLAKDLASGNMPTYAHIVPNNCNEMHGLDLPETPSNCRYDNDPGLIARGDAMVGQLLKQLQSSPVWTGRDNTAIVITFDEDDGPHPTRDKGKTQGCCGYEFGSPANYGGGKIPTIVITNHGPRRLVDDTPYNHYSLLRTTEDALGITEYLGAAKDAAHGVRAMDKLFWK